MKQIKKIIELINYGQNSKQEVVFFKKVPIAENFLIELIKSKIIYKYTTVELKKTYFLKIYLKYYKTKGMFHNINYFLGYKIKQRISYTQILQIKHYIFLIFLQTVYGIIPLKKAIELKIGGKIICILI